MMGDLRSHRLFFLERIKRLPSLPVYSMDELFYFVEKEKLYGKGLSLTDAQILYAAIINHNSLWTLDHALQRAAEKYDIRWNKLQN